MGSDSIVNQRQKKQVQIKKLVQYVGEAGGNRNTMKTELRQYNLAIIITVDTLRSSAGRAYFEVVNY